ncbi:hypothetical protein [Polluticoccus soli]|uniref:hypothetical protein n=1 Tax=Polluticoccus soli TaxID=3034150 RepID=UPI0023E299D3|nr:hypothetical protein [Flavipsychrobacter sp. JY13-12]
MAVFKVVFLKNEVLACHELLSPPHEAENVKFEHDKNGHLIYAMIPADSAREAHIKAMELVKDMRRSAPRN